MIITKYLLIVDEEEEYIFNNAIEANKKALKFLEENRDIRITSVLVSV